MDTAQAMGDWEPAAEVSREGEWRGRSEGESRKLKGQLGCPKQLTGSLRRKQVGHCKWAGVGWLATWKEPQRG